ncbi:Fumarylacetoacetase [Niveomyces insectorum RCEF 264]|uniref:Fumarylacetoacetase n=1 Tax=Niveomyces insectorum RCEF 264 TaxID=1081102 RepID=A0A167P588_9HYPO|nr:Fumarylacetoacetase [Niveomyces insectorum RCEF 264]
MASWVEVPQGCDFSLANLPYGVFSHNSNNNNNNSSNRTSTEPRIGTAIGEYVLDLKGLAREGMLAELEFNTTTLEAPNLNEYAALGRAVHRRVRAFLQEILKADTALGLQLRDHADRRRRLLVPLSDVTMHLPMAIGGYTDFFVGIYHADNCARIFRPGQPRNPNYTNLPVAYSGRASSIVVSGTSFHRPYGQYALDGQPTFAPSRKLDFEVEFGAFIAQGNAFGEPIDVQQAEDHIFGFVLLNDWSSRDVQRWEAQPLGPFNGKSFCTTISPWIVTPDALEPYKTEPVKTGTDVLSYLAEGRQQTVYDIPIDVSFIWPRIEEIGCLLEATEDGQTPRELHAVTGASESLQPSSILRRYLEDGDEVEFRASIDVSHAANTRGMSGKKTRHV